MCFYVYTLYKMIGFRIWASSERNQNHHLPPSPRNLATSSVLPPCWSCSRSTTSTVSNESVEDSFPWPKKLLNMYIDFGIDLINFLIDSPLGTLRERGRWWCWCPNMATGELIKKNPVPPMVLLWIHEQCGASWNFSWGVFVCFFPSGSLSVLSISHQNKRN